LEDFLPGTEAPAQQGGKGLAASIKNIDVGSPLEGKVHPGDRLISIGGNRILDVLDYKYYAYQADPVLVLEGPDGRKKVVMARKEPEEDLGLCDVLILAIYPRDTLDFLRRYAGRIKKGSIVMDCCGVKGCLCAPAWDIAREHGFTFVGGHPMEGLAKIGFDSASGALFQRASMILAPDRDIDLETMKRLKDLLDAMGFGHYEISSPEKHDRIIAYTSQLAHVLSNAYVKLPEALEHSGFSAGSFRDLTRVSYLNEVMWAELFMENADNLAGDIERLAGELLEYAAAIRQGDEARLRELLRAGKEQKLKVEELREAKA